MGRKRMLREIKVRTTRKEDVIDITEHVREAVREAGVKEAGVFVYVPHTTAAITIHGKTNAEGTPMLNNILRVATTEEDADSSQKKAAFVAPTEVLIAVDGKLLLGEDQHIYLYEFDGPQERSVYVLLIPTR
ncbi:MAG TPA: hypothetical protein ENF26_02540 [Methanomicrobia archaeon]|nr:hypothetical protein [Methanomicrobia archaeon]HEX59010.1 hypothetical protein [Methanomicrobia archaeon]